MFFTSALFQALFIYSQQVPGKIVSFTSAPFQALFIFSQQVPGKKSVLYFCPFPGTFHLFTKSAWQKKSAWEPGSQDPAYSAPLLMMENDCSDDDALEQGGHGGRHPGFLAECRQPRLQAQD